MLVLYLVYILNGMEEDMFFYPLRCREKRLGCERFTDDEWIPPRNWFGEMIVFEPAAMRYNRRVVAYAITRVESRSNLRPL